MELIFASGEEINKANVGLAIIADMTEVYGIVADAETASSEDFIMKIHEHMLANTHLFTEQFLGFVYADKIAVGDQQLNHLFFVPLSVITEEGISEANSEQPLSFQVFNNLNEPVAVEADGQVPYGQLSDTPPVLIDAIKTVWTATTKKLLAACPVFTYNEQHDLVVVIPLAHKVFAELMLTKLGLIYKELIDLCADKFATIAGANAAVGSQIAECCNAIYATKLTEVDASITDEVERQYLALAATIRSI